MADSAAEEKKVASPPDNGLLHGRPKIINFCISEDNTLDTGSRGLSWLLLLVLTLVNMQSHHDQKR
jgi:hypothetical protein